MQQLFQAQEQIIGNRAITSSLATFRQISSVIGGVIGIDWLDHQACEQSGSERI
ncbi:hypothetical protein ACFSR0_10245 [Enterococcus camelliae]|uniref:Uncharacterized protein n=1 Tax=Enterococcus camelliae TaxID=453959 RepID=A0ABW5TM64_9ENTE